MGRHAVLGESRQPFCRRHHLALRLWTCCLDSSRCSSITLPDSVLSNMLSQFLTIPPIAVMRLVFTALAYALSGYFLLKKFVPSQCTMIKLIIAQHLPTPLFRRIKSSPYPRHRSRDPSHRSSHHFMDLLLFHQRRTKQSRAIHPNTTLPIGGSRRRRGYMNHVMPYEPTFLTCFKISVRSFRFQKSNTKAASLSGASSCRQCPTSGKTVIWYFPCI